MWRGIGFNPVPGEIRWMFSKDESSDRWKVGLVGLGLGVVIGAVLAKIIKK